MAYNFDPTKPTGTQPGYDMDDEIRDTRAGVIAMVGTEHTVDVSNPAAVTAVHKANFVTAAMLQTNAVTAEKLANGAVTPTKLDGNAKAGYGTAASKPTTGVNIEVGRLYVDSTTKKLLSGTGTTTVELNAANADTVGSLAKTAFPRFATGSFAGNGGTITITLGWEPSYVKIIRNSSSSAYDGWDGIKDGSNFRILQHTDGGHSLVTDKMTFTATGFTAADSANVAGVTYLYVAFGVIS
jgi:hypothetical protein